MGNVERAMRHKSERSAGGTDGQSGTPRKGQKSLAQRQAKRRPG